MHRQLLTNRLCDRYHWSLLSKSNMGTDCVFAAAGRKILRMEEDFIKKMCAEIIAMKPDLVITEKGVSDLSLHYLVRAGISVLRRVRKSDNNRIARCAVVWLPFVLFLWGGEVCSVVTVCSLSLGRGGLQCGDCLFSFLGEVFSVVTVCSLSFGRGGFQCGDCLFSFFGEGMSSVW